MKFKAGKFLLAGIACLAMTAATYADAATLRVTVSARGNQRAVWQSAFDQFGKAFDGQVLIGRYDERNAFEAPEDFFPAYESAAPLGIALARASRFITDETCHLPPRADWMPR